MTEFIARYTEMLGDYLCRQSASTSNDFSLFLNKKRVVYACYAALAIVNSWKFESLVVYSVSLTPVVIRVIASYEIGKRERSKEDVAKWAGS